MKFTFEVLNLNTNVPLKSPKVFRKESTCLNYIINDWNDRYLKEHNTYRFTILKDGGILQQFEIKDTF